MPTNIDQLSIEIVANADKAQQSITKLTSSLIGLSTALNRINTSSISKFAKSVESLSTVGRRADDTSNAVKKMSDSLAKEFGVKSREGINAIRTAMDELLESFRKFGMDQENFALGEALEAAQRNAESAVREYARIEKQLDSTTQSVYEYVKATNTSKTKVSISDMAEEFGENLASMKRALGSGFTEKLKSTQQGVMDFAEYLTEMNQKLGTSFNTETIDIGFRELVETMEYARNSTMSYNQAVAEGAIDARDANYSLRDYSNAMWGLVRAETDLRKNNGIDALAESFTKLSNIELPDFTPFAETIKTLNRLSTERVVKNITAVKGALEGTIQTAQDVENAFGKISDSTTKMRPATRDIEALMEKMSQGADVSTIEMLGDGFDHIRVKCQEASLWTDEFKEKLDASTTGFSEYCSALDKAANELDKVSDSAKAAGEEIEDAAKAAEKAKLGPGEGAAIGIAQIAKKAKELGANYAAAAAVFDKFSHAMDRCAEVGVKAFKAMLVPLKGLKKFSEMLVEDFKEHTRSFTNMLNSFRSKADHVFSDLGRFWKRAMRTFTFMVIRKGFTAVINNIKSATDELAQFEYYADKLSNGRFNTSLSHIIADFQWIGRSIVAAFEPLINFVMPILNTISAAISNIMAKIGEFLAALTGQKYFVKGKKTVTNYAESLQKEDKEKDKTKKKEKDINKELKEREKLLLGIDELNILPKKPEDKDTAEDLKDDIDDALSDIDGVNFGEMFETAPVSKAMQDFADKVKQALADLFEPMKKAWDKAGPYVISGFKDMVSEVGKLGKSMWRDFIKVWKQDETVKIFENLLLIIGDLERVVGSLAKRFREAWDEVVDGKTRGQQIFEGIRNILGTIIQHVRNVTQYMKDWAEKISFQKLLQALSDLLKKLDKVADFLGGVFEDVMKNVVLEHIRWLIEEGLPHLMHAIGEVIDSFDFDDLRQKLQPVEKAFEQMRQNIDEGLVNAMKNLGKAVGQWTQTEQFQKFLDAIVHFMSQITAERVEKLFTGLGMGILKVVQALADFIGSDEFTEFIDEVFAWFDSISADDIANFFAGIAGGIGKIVEALAKFVTSEPFKWFANLVIDWFKNTDAEKMAKELELLAIAIAGFKFLSFAGTGFSMFYKLATMEKIAKGIPELAKNLTTLATAAETAGTAGAAAAKGVEAAGAGAATAAKGAAAAGSSTAAAGTSLATVAGTAALATADLALVAADFHNLKEASDTYTEAQNTHTKEVDNALANLKKLYETKGPEVAAEWAKTVYDVDITGQSLYEAQNTVWKEIDKTWEDIPQNMFAGFSQGWNDYFGKDGTGLLDLCGDAFTQFVGGIKDILGIASPSKVMSDIGENTVEGFKNGITDNWDSLTTEVGSLITQLVTSFTTGLSGIGTAIGTAFIGIQTAIVEKVGTVVSAAVGKFSEFKTGVTTKFNEAKNALVTGAGKLITEFGNKLKQIPKDANTYFTELKKNVDEKFKAVKQAISDKLKDSIDVVNDKLNKIKEKFQKVDLSRIAQNIIRGFTSGLKSKWADVVSWANDAVAKLKAKFSEALQINSPSKVFEQYGVYTVEGFNKGISEFSDSTSKTIDKWVGSFSAMEVSLAPSLLNSGGPAQVYQTSMVADSTITKDDLKTILNDFATTLSNQNQNNRIVLEIDGRRLYDVVVRQDKNNIMRTGRSAFGY